MGSLCTGKPATTSNSTSYSPAGLSNINDIWNTVRGAAATPYQPYGGQLVAPVNQQQTQGINTVNSAYGSAFPYINTAGNYATSAGTAINPNDISAYMNPYTSNVINATKKQFNEQNAQQQQGLLGNAAAQGALGGDRSAVAQAILAGQQQTAQAPVIANLQAQNYNQALSAAQADRAAKLAAASGLTGVGATAANLGLSTGASQIGAGTLQQQTRQAQNTADYQQYLQRLGYPFQTAQFLASYGLPVATAMGGTQTGTSQAMPSQASPLSQGIGLAAAALPFFLKHGGRVDSYANGGMLEYKKNSEGNWDWQPYADGGSTAAMPWSLTSIPSYVPPVSFSPVATRPQITPMQSPSTAGSDGNSFGTSQQVGNVLGGARNLIDQWSIPSSSIDPGAIGALGSGFSFSKGGVVGMVHEMRRALKKYADGGDVIANDFAAISPYTIGGSSPSLPSTISQVPTNLDFGSAAFGSAPSQPVTGTEAIPLARSKDITTPTDGYADNMVRYGKIIGNMESSGDYGQLGPPTKSGDRAYGKYGVMGANIPEWTTEVLGKPLTPQQFLSNPQAQDTVFRAKFGQYVNKYGPEGAAKAWFAGPNGMWNPGASDVLGTTVASYGNKFMSALGGSPNGTDVASIPPEAQPAQYTTPLSASPNTSASSPGLLSGLFGGKGLSDDARMALLSAGLGILGSNSPYALQAIGQGGSQGLQSYLQQRNLRRQYELQQQELAFRGQQLAQQARLAQLPYEKPTAGQLLQLQAAARPQLKTIRNVDGSETPVLFDPLHQQVLGMDGKPWKPDTDTSNSVQNIVSGVKGGLLPPSLTNVPRGVKTAVMAQFAREGFNLANAEQEWNAAHKQIQSLNGPQMIRYAGLAHSVINTIDEVQALAQQMQNTGVPLYNHARLLAYTQTAGNTAGGQLASRYLAAVGTLKEEFANLAQGGYAPTEPAWALANQQINADYGVNQLGSTLGEIQRLLRYRLQGIPNFEKLGPAAANRYTGSKSETNLGNAPAAHTPSAAKPTRVQQGGHIYELQADGTYKAVQ